MKVRKFKMYQTVSVVYNPSLPDAPVLIGRKYRPPRIGDMGTVLGIYTHPHEKYCVEAAAPDGRTEWLVEFLPDELKAV